MEIDRRSFLFLPITTTAALAGGGARGGAVPGERRLVLDLSTLYFLGYHRDAPQRIRWPALAFVRRDCPDCVRLRAVVEEQGAFRVFWIDVDTGPLLRGGDGVVRTPWRQARAWGVRRLPALLYLDASPAFHAENAALVNVPWFARMGRDRIYERITRDVPGLDPRRRAPVA